MVASVVMKSRLACAAQFGMIRRLPSLRLFSRSSLKWNPGSAVSLIGLLATHVAQAAPSPGPSSAHAAAAESVVSAEATSPAESEASAPSALRLEAPPSEAPNGTSSPPLPRPEGSPSELSETEWVPSDNDALEGHTGRSLVDMSAGLGLWAIMYWLMMDRNVADWDNPTPEERFTGEAWRLDNNSLGVNWIAHPLMGGASYAFARANHHGPATSFGYAFLTSFLWEFVLEFKEKVSVNDVIATPGTGVPIGEFIHKLGLYLDTHERPSTMLQAARWSVGIPVTLDRAIDGRPPPRVTSRDTLGFTRQIWHRFELSGGALFVDSPHTDRSVLGRTNFSARLATLPDYLAAVDRSRFFYMAEISDLSVGAEASRHGAGFTATADTLLAGFHSQQLESSSDQPRGTAITTGVSVAYRYLRSEANRYREFVEAEALPDPNLSHHVPTTAEQFAAFHLPGPAIDWHVLAPDLVLYLGARAHPDFVGFGAPAFYDWAAANLDEKGKHILHRQGYFHGWGASGELAGRLQLGPLRAAGNLFCGRYISQDGLDRHVERITSDVRSHGQLLYYGASVGVKPPVLPLVLSVDYGVRHWSSEVEGHVRRARGVAKGLSATLEF